MRKNTNLIRKVVMILAGIVLILVISTGNSKATSEIESYLKNSNIANIDVNNITEQEILDVYEEISDRFSTDEMLNLIEENKDKIKKQGISESTIEAGKEMIKTTDKEEIKEIIKENINPKDIKEKIEKGYTTEQIITSVIKEMPTEQKISAAGRIILSNQIVKISIRLIVIIFIYHTILRAIVYHKAGKKWFAAFIPFYRQITMYQICDLSLGYMLLWLVPIIGWIIMFFIAIMKRIYLSQKFGKGTPFGMGLVILPTIFWSVLAFNKKITYKEEY